jgi:hypothetical protein
MPETTITLRGARAARLLMFVMAGFFLFVAISGFSQPFVLAAGLSLSASAVAFAGWLKAKTPSKLVFTEENLEVYRGSEILKAPWNEIEAVVTDQMITVRFLHARGFLLLATNEGAEIMQKVAESLHGRPLLNRPAS